MSGFYTYILECADGSLYTGWTTDPEKRLATHNNGTGAKYTRARRPLKLVALWQFDSRSEAQRQENKIKALSRREKCRLIGEHAPAAVRRYGI